MVFLGREITEQRDYSDKVAEDIDNEVQNIILQSYSTCKRILEENQAKLAQIAQYLMVNEMVEGPELERLFESEIPPESAVAAGA